MKVIDLSHLIHEDMTVYPGTEQPKILPQFQFEKWGFRESKLSMFSHTGTHIDPPAHMLKAGAYLDELEVERFIGKAMVLDFSEKEDKVIDLDMIKPYEDKIRQVEFLIIRTGWEELWGTEEYFKGFPALSESAARWLGGFNLKGIGVDAISIDSMDTENFIVHNTLMKAGYIIIENLTNLKAVKEVFFTLSVLPLKYRGADGSPVRAIAMIY